MSFLTLTAIAQSLGNYGTAYPVDEPDMVEEIKAKIQIKMDSGEFDSYKKKAQETVRNHIQEPIPVAGLKHAEEGRVFYFDPTIRVKKDIMGANGVVVPAGTVVNPLEFSPFTYTWIFIDGRDDDQKKWALKQLKEGDGRARPILVAGRWMDLSKEWQRRVYFDQGGELVRKLGITATPAVVSQDKDGRRIKIEEILL